MDLQLGQKGVFVSGGLSNLGQAICTSLAQEGAYIVFSYTSDRKKDQALYFQKMLKESYNVKVCAVKIDIRDEISVEKGIAEAVEFLPHLDIVINNAGVFSVKEQHSLLESEWDQIMDVNIKGIWRVLRHTQPYLQKNRGVIVNVSSINASRPGFDHTCHYDASKGAVSAYTRSLAKELSEYNIRVNAVAPGLLASSSLKEEAPELVQSYVKRSALHSLVNPQDVAILVTLLASPLSKAITGEILTVDCGYGMM